jgi:hypothetical protein
VRNLPTNLVENSSRKPRGSNRLRILNQLIAAAIHTFRASRILCMGYCGAQQDGDQHRVGDNLKHHHNVRTKWRVPDRPSVRKSHIDATRIADMWRSTDDLPDVEECRAQNLHPANKTLKFYCFTGRESDLVGRCIRGV